MAKYLARNCPRCNGYLEIVLREPGRNVPLHAVTGIASAVAIACRGL